MRVLIVGGGAREHAFAWRLHQAGHEVWAAPGNAGLEAVARRVPTAARAEQLLPLLRRERIELTVIGPEAPLVAGLADGLRAGGAAVLGPCAAAAQIEASKSWARELCRRHGLPGPEATRCAPEAAPGFAAGCPLPVAIKADGLMAGKGVVIARSRPEAAAAAARLAAHGPVLFEEFLEGREISAFALCDGRRAACSGIARDHKRLGAGDTGPMTGGMGAFCPVPDVSPAEERAAHGILQAAVTALEAEGRPFVGFLFAGLMLTAAGPRVLEFNCRFGDPEAQSLLPLLQGDPAPQWLRAAQGRLEAQEQVRFQPGCALGVVLAAPGYPEAPRPGQAIPGLRADGQPAAGGLVFHAAASRDGLWRTAGGRILTAVGRGPTLAAARQEAYATAAAVAFPGALYRRDMGDPGGQA